MGLYVYGIRGRVLDNHRYVMVDVPGYVRMHLDLQGLNVTAYTTVPVQIYLEFPSMLTSIPMIEVGVKIQNHTKP